MELCRICNAANGNAFSEGECYICRGGMSKLEGMIEEGIKLAREAGKFSISTLMPKDWMSREEKAWDSRLSGAESLKNHANRLISSRISAMGPRYDKDGEIRLVFDLAEGSVSVSQSELFIFGRYLKRSAGLSQSRWVCSSCNGKGCPKCHGKGKMYESVEERIGVPMKEAAEAGDYVMHASGREDVDATNSAGRPFVMELKGAKKREMDLAGVSEKIAASGEVAVTSLRMVPRTFLEIVTESHFDKTYEAVTEFGRALEEEDLGKIRALEGRTILQQTPARVAHRRADLVRHRKVKHIEVVNAGDAGKLATLIIKAEAGTYIKELISGDGGRTNPSVAGTLGCPAACRKLDVSGIDDGYLDFVLEGL